MKEYIAVRDRQRQEEKGYVIPSEDDVIFYGYKAPLTPFKGGHGFVGVLRYSKDKEMAQCHFCGRLFRNVGSHAFFTHGMKAIEYKEKTGLAMGTALVGERTREKLIASHDTVPSFSQIGKTKEEVREKMRTMGEKARGRRTRPKWSLERRNLNGNCPEQLIDRIKRLQKKLGKRPSAKQYAKEYGSYQSVMTVYGKWNKALEVAGMATYTTEKGLRSDRKYLLAQLKQFYDKHGRTARTSDMKRGLLPNHQIYWKVFGSLNNARQLAGVPVVIQLSKFRFDEVMLPKKGG